MLKKPGALFIWNSPPGLFFYALKIISLEGGKNGKQL
jgi:hypothetical protein